LIIPKRYGSDRDEADTRCSKPVFQGSHIVDLKREPRRGDVVAVQRRWRASRGRKTKICAFTGADFNVEPDPPVDKSAILYWGVRLGMFDQIDRRQDLDSAHAMIHTVPSRAAAMIYCREFVRDYTQVCIAKAQASRRPQELTADCLRKTFTGFNGWRAAYIGPNPGDPSVAPADEISAQGSRQRPIARRLGCLELFDRRRHFCSPLSQNRAAAGGVRRV
jgi:hypothetical protein